MTKDESLHVTVPLDEWGENLVMRALEHHLNSCPLKPRVEAIERRWLLMAGCTIGSGLLGGGASVLLNALLGQ